MKIFFLSFLFIYLFIIILGFSIWRQLEQHFYTDSLEKTNKLVEKHVLCIKLQWMNKEKPNMHDDIIRRELQ